MCTRNIVSNILMVSILFFMGSAYCADNSEQCKQGGEEFKRQVSESWLRLDAKLTMLASSDIDKNQALETMERAREAEIIERQNAERTGLKLKKYFSRKGVCEPIAEIVADCLAGKGRSDVWLLEGAQAPGRWFGAGAIGGESISYVGRNYPCGSFPVQGVPTPVVVNRKLGWHRVIEYRAACEDRRYEVSLFFKDGVEFIEKRAPSRPFVVFNHNGKKYQLIKDVSSEEVCRVFRQKLLANGQKRLHM